VTFSTDNLQFAIYLHASKRLEFEHCELVRAGKVHFIFADPHHIGDELELQFEQGGQLSAVALFASQKFLRRKMSEALHDRYEHTNHNWRTNEHFTS